MVHIANKIADSKSQIQDFQNVRLLDSRFQILNFIWSVHTRPDSRFQIPNSIKCAPEIGIHDSRQVAAKIPYIPSLIFLSANCENVSFSDLHIPVYIS